MSNAIADLQPTQFVFTVRFDQGYRFLDRCGNALIRLENILDAGWIQGEIAPTGGQLRNFTLGMGAKFNSESLTVAQSEFLSFEHFLDQTCKIYDILRSTFEIKQIHAPVLRVIYQIGFSEADSAEELLRRLKLCRPEPDLLATLDGDEAAFNFTLCMQKDVAWQGIQTKQRKRIDVKVVRQERQPYFDERLMQRAALLSPRNRDAMRSLRELRRQHSMIAETAAQFEVENLLESDFNSGTFDLAEFMTRSRETVESIREFLQSKLQRE